MTCDTCENGLRWCTLLSKGWRPRTVCPTVSDNGADARDLEPYPASDADW